MLCLKQNSQTVFLQILSYSFNCNASMCLSHASQSCVTMPSTLSLSVQPSNSSLTTNHGYRGEICMLSCSPKACLLQSSAFASIRPPCDYSYKRDCRAFPPTRWNAQLQVNEKKPFLSSSIDVEICKNQSLDSEFRPLKVRPSELAKSDVSEIYSCRCQIHQHYTILHDIVIFCAGASGVCEKVSVH